MEPREGLRDGDLVGHARAQLHRRRGMVVRGRHPHRARFPLPLRRGRDQGRRHHHQHPRHRRLHGAGGILRAHQDAARARAEFRQGALLGALPRRPRHGGGELARRRARRHPPDRMHRQRHRRARRQRLARRGRDGDEGAQRRAAVLDQRRRHDAHARLEAGLGRDLVPGAVQQGDRRPERVRARERHPPGRHAQAHPDLRDHDAGERRREADLAGDGQAFRPPRLRAQARGAGLHARRQPARGRLRALQGARRPQEARLRRGHRGAGRRGDRAPRRTASSSSRSP